MDDPPPEAHKIAVFWALASNILVFVCKFAIALVTGSSVLFAEGVHSLADSLNQVLLLYGLKRSRKKPTTLHPFGYGRESYFWAFMVAVLIFTLGGFFSILQGVDKIFHPTPMHEWRLAYAVLALSAFFEGLSLLKAWRIVNGKRKDKTIYQFLKNSKEPSLIVVFLEDLVAEFGILIAFIGIGLSHVTNSSLPDAIATVAIGVLLGCIAIFLTAEVRSLLVGERASQLDEYKIRRAVDQTAMVERLTKLSTQHLGPDEILVTMNCRFPEYYNATEIARAIDVIAERIQAAVPHAKQIFIKPSSRTRFKAEPPKEHKTPPDLLHPPENTGSETADPATRDSIDRD